jgi:diaminohydroxyphosphoribosylaminopyrimidine deaminase/5-amino-6-(5-phosphoribosylamino)uracil reductase
VTVAERAAAATAAETAAMRRAIDLGACGELSARPNPNVGCVILDPAGRTVGKGWHAYAGGPHAEVAALAEAGAEARGGTAVVTLEPCAHTGRTGPCTDVLQAAGIARVVYAVADPSPAAGGGAETLRRGGIDVVGGVLTAEAERANARWLTSIRHHRPFTIWKYAATLDGRVAAADRTSRWITGPQARAEVHEMRAASDAVIVGVDTVLADDPQHTVRGTTTQRQPLRVVVDTHARTPSSAKVRDAQAQTWIAAGAELGRDSGGHVDLATLAHRLHERGVQQALLEGGPTLAAAFLRAGLVDRVVAYLAPTLLGAGPPAVGDLGIPTLADAIRLELLDCRRVGDDIRIEAAITAKEA